MIKRSLLVFALVALAVVPAFCTTTQITGTLTDATGTPITGTACLRLPVNAVDTSTNRALSPLSVCFPLTNGVFPAFASVVPNDVIKPGNTYYQLRVTNSAGEGVFAANYIILTGGGTFNIGTAIPTLVTTSNISMFNPASLGANNIWTGTNTYSAAVTFNSTTTLGAAGTFLFSGLATVSATSNFIFAEGSFTAQGAGLDACRGDSTSHTIQCDYNNTSYHSLRLTEVGTCTMVAGTCTVTWPTQFSATPLCNVTWNGTGALTGIVKGVPSTSNCVVTSSAGGDTAVMQVVGTANPN